MTENEDYFETFWDAGMRKAGAKKKALASFNKVINKKSNKQEFLNFLIGDIHSRLVCMQLGFDQMHPATYLNGERWNDEKQDNLPF